MHAMTDISAPEKDVAEIVSNLRRSRAHLEASLKRLLTKG
jgi:predicted transcriptional regulator